MSLFIGVISMGMFEALEKMKRTGSNPSTDESWLRFPICKVTRSMRHTKEKSQECSALSVAVLSKMAVRKSKIEKVDRQSFRAGGTTHRNFAFEHNYMLGVKLT